MHQRLLSQRRVGAGLGIRASQVEFMEGIAHDGTAMLDITVGELLIELLDPVQKRLLRCGQRLQVAVLVTRHESPLSLVI